MGKSTHKVLRPVPNGTETIPAGTEVDASEWLYTDLLVRQGYITPITDVKIEPILSLEDEPKQKPWEQKIAA